jgi:hypothetical protein
MFCAVLALVAHIELPIDLDGIGLERARALSGRPVVASLVAGEPYYYPEYGFTSVGAQTRDDGAERHVVMRGQRYDVKAGERVRVVCVLRVIDYEPAFVGPVLVPAWTEVRVSEG